ncbi:hypothetical protein ACLOJK_021112 [Asimina triloba]
MCQDQLSTSRFLSWMTEMHALIRKHCARPWKAIGAYCVRSIERRRRSAVARSITTPCQPISFAFADENEENTVASLVLDFGFLCLGKNPVCRSYTVDSVYTSSVEAVGKWFIFVPDQTGLPFSPGPRKKWIVQLEKLFSEVDIRFLNQNFYQRIVEKLNRASGRAGKTAIHWKQVRSWFLMKQREAGTPKVTSSTILSKEAPIRAYPCVSNEAPESSSDVPKGEKSPDVAEIEFEARSSKDGAWYDVATFLTHRIISSGEPEVRVRYVGFGAEEDEWVNVKKAVRERSIPLEPSECRKVNIGDLVLCYRERRDNARYYDAHILEIQRRLHDIRGCRCLFLIRYDHDHSEYTAPINVYEPDSFVKRQLINEAAQSHPSHACTMFHRETQLKKNMPPPLILIHQHISNFLHFACWGKELNGLRIIFRSVPKKAAHLYGFLLQECVGCVET